MTREETAAALTAIDAILAAKEADMLTLQAEPVRNCTITKKNEPRSAITASTVKPLGLESTAPALMSFSSVVPPREPVPASAQ